MLKKITTPDKIIITGGLPRSGKTIIKSVLNAHSHVAHVPSGLNFFYWFSKDKYENRGGFEQNLDYYFQHCRKSKSWGLTRDMVHYTGSTRKELYLIILETYRSAYHPTKKYIAEYTHLSEVHLDTLIDWFGMDKLRFIQIIRNPYDNYASHVISRGVSYQDRRDHYNSFVNKFCNMWSQSAAIGLYNNTKYPKTFNTLFYEDILSNPKNTIKSLCNWIGVTDQTDIMLNKTESTDLQNSVFIKNKIDSNITIQIDSYNRKECLTDYEINMIDQISCPDFITAMKYVKQGTIIDFKHIPSEVDLFKYRSTMLAMIVSYLSPLPPHKALVVLLRVCVKLLNMVPSIGTDILSSIFSKLKYYRNRKQI
jgi:hypothetical protein